MNHFKMLSCEFLAAFKLLLYVASPSVFNMSCDKNSEEVDLENVN